MARGALLKAFQWKNNKAVTPEEAARQRDIATKLATQPVAKNLGEGLGKIGDAIRYIALTKGAAAGEEEGLARASQLYAGLGSDSDQSALIAAMSEPWANPGQKAIASTLLSQQLEAQDPLKQAQLSKAQAELDALQNPVADPYTLGEGQTRFSGDNVQVATGLPSSPETIINNNTGGTDDFYKKLDTDAAAATVATMEAGQNARSNNMRLGQLEQHLSRAPQGAKGALVQAVGALGIDVGGLSDVQAAQALINQMVPGQRPPGSGTMSDADLLLFKASLPAIINQPGGNEYILQTAKAINDYTIALADIATQVANRQISPADGRALAAAVPNPLADFKAQVGASELPAPDASGVITLPDGRTIQQLPD